MTKHRTEQVYDDEIRPLLRQAMAIAEREGIPFVAASAVVREDGLPAECLSFTVPDAVDERLASVRAAVAALVDRVRAGSPWRIFSLLSLFACVPDRVAPVHEPWEDARPYAFDRDHDGWCGGGRPTLWLLPGEVVPPDYIACPFEDGDLLGFDCDDHERWEPLNLGAPGGCGDDPWAS